MIATPLTIEVFERLSKDQKEIKKNVAEALKPFLIKKSIFKAPIFRMAYVHQFEKNVIKALTMELVMLTRYTVDDIMETLDEDVIKSYIEKNYMNEGDYV